MFEGADLIEAEGQSQEIWPHIMQSIMHVKGSAALEWGAGGGAAAGKEGVEGLRGLGTGLH